eukprot:CAMPEP_0185023018 /NCGR_PEP_ID=MMETSP1103-20130426/5723_1 /TAXON_ID=36769 /ORGANISM="Paraphysomonas bandaiensis, Strain Caron Lab Isolate" /LENGTH=274 /DNA_ID=CAMNT_0027555395 /DNA_START=22 /DNA_END=842 /DNA_ORIENTATION=-
MKKNCDYKADIEAYFEEHHRLLRALNESLDREKHLLRQLRRLKENLVSTALKLQVASKAVECDETAIKYLRRDLEEARKAAHVSAQKEEVANDLIQSLRLEIIQLKRRLRDENDTNSPPHAFVGSQASVYQDADNQVMKMMSKRGVVVDSTYEDICAVKEKDRPTHFQEWKMKQFVWAPDTPGASINRDEQAVEELLHAVMHPPDGVGIMKPNKATITKQRRPGTTGYPGNRSGQLPGLPNRVQTTQSKRRATTATSPASKGVSPSPISKGPKT